jgi:hypothetical protein
MYSNEMPGIIFLLAMFAIFILACLYLWLKNSASRLVETNLVQCDLCPQKISPKTGKHPESIGIGQGKFHNVHFYRQQLKEPMIQGDWFKNQKARELKEAAEKEKNTDKELDFQYNEIMNQPVGEDFLKTLDI